MTQLYYLEDLVPGTQTTSLARTITETDIVNFAGLAGDYSPIHVDETWAKANTPFGGRIAHGMLVTSISYALRAGIIDQLSFIGWLEANRRFKHPVRAGDTIHTVWSVRETRPSESRPDSGLVILDIEVINQDGLVVQDGFDTVMIHRKPAEQ